MGLVLVGLNHRSAPVELREKLAFDAEAVRRGLAEFARRVPDAEVVILSTCNRVEVVAFHDRDAGLVDAIERFLADFHRVAGADLAGRLYRFRGREAVAHLFRVASSLDSMVPGESQIGGQVKEAYRSSVAAGRAGKHLNALFQRALRAGKLVRTGTDIARHKVSVSSVAVDLARAALGELSKKTALVLGAGETGRFTLRSLTDAGVRRILVAGRTASRARKVAKDHGGDAVDWKDLPTHLAAADLVVCCTSSRRFVLGREDVSAALAGRRRRPLVVIDIAVPRNVDPDVADVPGVRLYDVDDIEKTVAGNLDRRERELRRGLEVVDREVRKFEEWLDRHEIEETLATLMRQATDASRAELEKLWLRLPDVAPAQRKAIASSVERLVKRIMHGPVEILQAQVAAQQAPRAQGRTEQPRDDQIRPKV